MGRSNAARKQETVSTASHLEDADDLPQTEEGSSEGWPDWNTVPWHPELSGEGVIRSGHADSPSRNEERRLIRVTVESANGTTVCGQRVPNGVSYLLVYESDVAKVVAMLPTTRQRRMLALAQEQFDAELEAFIQECGGNKQTAEETRGFTVWTFYDQNTRRMKGLSGGYPIVRAVEVCEAPVPAPETPESTATRARAESNESIQELVRTLLHLTKGRSE